MATFAVIIPTYNRASLVQRTLQTVFSQVRPADEIIVVDNCSTDETANVLRPLAQRGRITFLQHEQNLERAASRNTGLDHATSDFVTFLDSDDLMYPRNLADADSFVSRSPHVRLFHNLYEHVAPDGRRIHRRGFPSLRDPRGAIADGNFMSCIGNFVHRDLYPSLRFDTDERISGSEDWEFWMRAISRARPARIEQFNSGVVHHSERTVATVDLASLRRRLEALTEKVKTDAELASAYHHYYDRLEASKFLLLASAANSLRDPRTAFAFVIEALRARPSAIATEKAARILAHASLDYMRSASARGRIAAR